MNASTREPQALIELSKQDLRVLLVTAALAPVLFFSAGLFTTSVLSEISVSTKTESTPITASPASPNTLPPQVILSTSNNHSLAVAPTRVVAAEPEGYYLIQAGVFSSFSNARRYHQELSMKQISAEIIEGDNQGIHRVILNKFKSEEAATQALAAYQHKYAVKLYISFIPGLAKIETIAAI